MGYRCKPQAKKLIKLPNVPGAAQFTAPTASPAIKCLSDRGRDPKPRRGRANRRLARHAEAARRAGEHKTIHLTVAKRPKYRTVKR